LEGWREETQKSETNFEEMVCEMKKFSLNNEKGPLEREWRLQPHLHELIHKFWNILELRQNNPDLNMALKTKDIVYHLGMQFIEYNYFEESIEVLMAVRTVANKTVGVNKLIDIDKMIILCYVNLNIRNEAIQAVKVFEGTLVRSFGTVEVVKVLGKEVLNALEIVSLDFNSI